MGSIGPMEIVLLGILAVLLFGPGKLPDIGRQVGKGVRDFKDAIDGTGIKDAIDGVADVRSAVSPTNVARTFVPGVADTQDAVAEAKGAVADVKSAVNPTEGAGAKDGAGAAEGASAPAEPAVPQS